MPEAPTASRRLLPLLTGVFDHGRRSLMTCRYRCGNACNSDAPNASANPYFPDVVAEGLSRRSLLRAGALAALVAGTGVAGARSAPAAGLVPTRTAGTAAGPAGGGLTFIPVPPNTL